LSFPRKRESRKIMIKEWIPDAVYPCGSRGRNDKKMIWIPDAVYPCEACPCESRE